jgi:PAS domain S-box-containing protein
MSNEYDASTTSPRPLRHQAEERWRTKHGHDATRSAEDVQAALYELEVHQIELELQNEHLRATQDELIEVRNRYQDLYDFAPVGYVTLDIHRVIREANLTAATMLGLERGKLLGMRMEGFVGKSARDAFFVQLQKTEEGGSSFSLCLRRHDGAEFFARLEMTVFNFPRADGARYRIAIADVSKLHDAEDALAQSERRFRALTEKGADYITVVNAAGLITYENPTAIRTLGFDAGDLMGRNVFDFAHPEDQAAVRRLFDEVVASKEHTVEAEVRARARSGAWRWLHVVATNLLDDPAVGGVVLNSRDVTERREAVKELRRMNEVLEERVRQRTAAIQEFQEHLLRIADQTQQRIAQDLHDDLGQELTGLSLRAETLAEILAGGAPHAAKLAADVLAAVERARSKVRNLARRVLPIEIELNSLGGALARLAEDAASGARVACEFHNDHPETTFDSRIAMQLYRIAQEAVANALRHAQPKHVHIELADEQGQTVLQIADDGRGMPAEAADGLGLRIMRYRAGMLGGTLEVLPGKGGGTVVVCRLPAAKSCTPVRRRRK